MLHAVTTGAYYPQVVRYYMEDFDYRSILVDSGTIVQCTTEYAIEVTGRYESALKTGFQADCIESGKRNKKKTVRNLQLV